MKFDNTYRPKIDVAIVSGLDKRMSGGRNYGLMINGNVVFTSNDKEECERRFVIIENSRVRFLSDIDTSIL